MPAAPAVPESTNDHGFSSGHGANAQATPIGLHDGYSSQLRPAAARGPADGRAEDGEDHDELPGGARRLERIEYELPPSITANPTMT
jgi:hypothetical protein